MRAGGIWLFGEPEEESEMENKEKVLERFMRDQEHKANSLYNSGYRAGYEEGYKKGFGEGMARVYEDLEQEERMQKAIDESVLHVGDEIEDSNGLIGIVTNTDTHYHIFYPHNGKTWKASKDMHFKKTGRTYNCKEFFYAWSPF